MRPSTTHHHTVTRGHEYHVAYFIIQDSVPELQHNGYVRRQKDSGAEVCRWGFPKFPNRLPHMGFPHIRPILPPAGRNGNTTLMRTKGKNWSYLGHPPFHAGSLALVLNIRTRHIPPSTMWSLTTHSPLWRT